MLSYMGNVEVIGDDSSLQQDATLTEAVVAQQVRLSMNELIEELDLVFKSSDKYLPPSN
jgi:hypothetical protein